MELIDKLYDNTLLISSNFYCDYNIFRQELEKVNLRDLDNIMLNKILNIYLRHVNSLSEISELDHKIVELVNLPEFKFDKYVFDIFEVFPRNAFLLSLIGNQHFDTDFITEFLFRFFGTEYLFEFHKYIKINSNNIIILLLRYSDDYFKYLEEDLNKLDIVDEKLLEVLFASRCFENPHLFTDDEFTRSLGKEHFIMFKKLIDSKKIKHSIQLLRLACGNTLVEVIEYLISLIEPDSQCIDSVVNSTIGNAVQEYCDKYNLYNRFRNLQYQTLIPYVINILIGHKIFPTLEHIKLLITKNITINNFNKCNLIPDDELFEMCLSNYIYPNYFDNFEFTHERLHKIFLRKLRLMDIIKLFGTKKIKYDVECLKLACKIYDVDVIEYLLNSEIKPNIECFRILCERINEPQLNYIFNKFLGTGIEPDLECLRRCISETKNEILINMFGIVTSKFISMELINRKIEIKKPCEEICMITRDDLKNRMYEECVNCHKPYLTEPILRWVNSKNTCPYCGRDWVWNDIIFLYKD
jgi:hypothetical protein